jgi:hypothetical protein
MRPEASPPTSRRPRGGSLLRLVGEAKKTSNTGSRVWSSLAKLWCSPRLAARGPLEPKSYVEHVPYLFAVRHRQVARRRLKNFETDQTERFHGLFRV